MKYVILAIIIIAAIIAGAGLLMASYVLHGKRQTLEEAGGWQADHYDISWYDVIEKKSYILKSFDGYELHVELLLNKKPSDDYVIVTHGFTDNRLGALKYARIYLDLGYNVVIYDLRGHGENEPSICTYTIRERKDLRDLIKDTRRRHPDLRRLGIHGESLGAATSIAVLNYQPDIDFVVSDCAFSDLRNVLKEAVKAMHLPEQLVDLAGFFMKLRYKVSFDDMRPIDSLARNRIPIMFMHGQDDSLISPMNSADMYQVTEGLKELHFFPGAPHAESVLVSPESYADIVKEFLKVVYSGEDRK